MGLIAGMLLCMVVQAPPDEVADADLLARGQQLLDAREFTAAEALFAHRLESRPADPDASFLLGLARFGKGDFEGAIAPLGVASAARSLDPLPLEFMGRALFQLERFEDSARAFELASRLDPQRPSNFNHLAAAELRMGQSDAALEHFQRAVDLDPDYAIARYNVGVLRLLTGDVDAARDNLQAAARLAAQDPDPAEALGDLERGEGNLAAAEDWYHEAFLRNGDGATAPRFLQLAAKCSAARADFVSARIDLECAAQLSDAPADVHRQLAAMLLHSGDLAGARRALEAVVELEPESVDDRRALADFLEDRGETEAARRELIALGAIGGADAAVHCRVARLSEALGDDAGALDHYHRLVEANDGSHRELLFIAERMLRSHVDGIRNEEQGRKLLDALLAQSRKSDPAALLVLGRTARDRGDAAQAAAAFLDAAELLDADSPGRAVLRREADQAAGR